MLSRIANNEKNIETLSVNSNETLLGVIHKMDETTHRLLIVMRNGNYVGLVSIGDIQRAIIKGISLESPVEKILCQKLMVASVRYDMGAIKDVITSL